MRYINKFTNIKSCKTTDNKLTDDSNTTIHWSLDATSASLHLGKDHK